MPTWIPSKDKERYIRWTLTSLAENTNKIFELIIIDNQATEKSRKFLKKLSQQFKNNKYCKGIKLIGSKDNLGWTGGWETGIDKSEGKYTCVINDDLVFSESWLSKMIAHLREDVVAVGPTSNFVSGRQLVKFNTKNSYEEKVNYLIGFCLLIERKALDTIKENDYYIDPRFYPGGSEELDLCIRLGKAGYDMVIARDVFIHHFGSRSLQYLDEFKKGQKNFYNQRLMMLEEKYGREALDVLDNNQRCPKIAIGIPTIGYTQAEFLAMYPWILQDAWAKFGAYNVLPIISPRNLIHVGRSEIVKKALQYGSEYLLCLDDDMLCSPDILWRLYSHQKDFVSALAYSRNKPYRPCIYKGKDKNGEWIPDVTLRKGLVQVGAVGLSCALIRMSVIKKLIRNKTKEIRERGGLFYFTKYGEDMNFTSELKKSGGVELWVDTNLVIKHLGNPIKVDENVFLNYQRLQQKRG